MKKFALTLLACLLAASFSLAASQTFVGTIGDSMCGPKHMMAGKNDKECTVECVKMGAKYILIDPNGKVYKLSDQKKPAPFAGEKVKVTGTLKGGTITVTDIEAAGS